MVTLLNHENVDINIRGNNLILNNYEQTHFELFLLYW